MRMTVIGTGYLGAVHAACMAELGHEVLGVDSDIQKIAALQEGRAPFFEPGLEEILGPGGGSPESSASVPPPCRRPRSSGTPTSSAVGTPQLPPAGPALT